DAFLVRDEAATSRAEAREIQQDDRSVLQAFAEYEDVEQNVYVARPRHRLKQGDIPYCKCKPLAGSSETCGASCENRVTQTECVRGHRTTKLKCGNQRMQDNYHSLLALRRVEGKCIGLFADSPIDNGDLVAQYVGEVITRQMYIDREKK
ncbi:hypothetical protein PF007_g30497, partial [Phytophthora fragariae]